MQKAPTSSQQCTPSLCTTSWELASYHSNSKTPTKVILPIQCRFSSQRICYVPDTLCYELTPIFFLLYFLYSFHVVTNWPPFSFFTFLYFFLVMWLSSDHFVTCCSCDIYCSVTSIVLWPIVQGDSIVPVMTVTLLFSFTISTSRLWPYSLRLDFLYLTVQQCNQSPIPTLILCPLSQSIHVTN